MNILKMGMILMSMLIGMYNFHGLQTLIQPVSRGTIDHRQVDSLRESLVYLGCPERQVREISNGITIASDRTGISRLLISSLLYTESRFRLSATSSKGYRGIMQTPTATMIYPEVDILHGAMILKEKLHLAKGNMLAALALYKGGRNPEARKQAIYVVKIYNNLLSRRAEGAV